MFFYYKINNFFNNFNQPDYRILDIDKNIAGSQCYGNNIAIMVNSEDIKSDGDLEQITEEEYLKLKKEIEEENKTTHEENNKAEYEKEETLTKIVAELTVENKKKDMMIKNLAQQVNALNIKITKQGGDK